MRCVATTKAGAPCRQQAVTGLDRCSAHLGRTGRRLNLTPELAEQLRSLLADGNYLAVSLRAVGLPKGTYDQWMRRGLSMRTRDRLFVDFRAGIEQAIAEGEARAVEYVADADDWRARAWLLERRWPDRWARPSQREKTKAEPDSAPVSSGDPFAEVDELAERRKRG